MAKLSKLIAKLSKIISKAKRALSRRGRHGSAAAQLPAFPPSQVPAQPVVKVPAQPITATIADDLQSEPKQDKAKDELVLFVEGKARAERERRASVEAQVSAFMEFVFHGKSVLKYDRVVEEDFGLVVLFIEPDDECLYLRRLFTEPEDECLYLERLFTEPQDECFYLEQLFTEPADEYLYLPLLFEADEADKAYADQSDSYLLNFDNLVADCHFLLARADLHAFVDIDKDSGLLSRSLMSSCDDLSIFASSHYGSMEEIKAYA